MSSTPEPTAHLTVSHQATAQLNDSNRVENLPGYTTPIFKGKEEQRALVEHDVASKVLISLKSL